MIPFVGHKKNWQLLTGEALSQRRPHAYLFYGLPGIGKTLVALTFVQWLLCHKRSPSGYPCNQCDPCRRVSQKNHPDFHFINEEKQGIKIETIRLLQRSLNQTPLEAEIKLTLIREAQQLTQQAANSLLKILEEPPGQTLFILTSPNLFEIIPTIRSRCFRLHFIPPDFEESVSLSRDSAPAESDMSDLLRITGGSIGWTKKTLNDNILGVLADLSKLADAPTPSFFQISTTVQAWIDSEIDLPFLLEMMKQRVWIRIKENESWEDLQKLDRIARAQRDIENNVSKVVVLENLLMGLHEVLHHHSH